MSHQDWKKVTITGLKSGETLDQQIRTGKVKREIVPTTTGGKNSNSSGPLIKDTDDIVVPEVTSRAVGHQIRDARTSESNKQNKKLTQSELDKLCNLPTGTIQKYENNTAIYNQNEIDKISRALGVVIKKHQSTKK